MHAYTQLQPDWSVDFDSERIVSANLELQYSRTVQMPHGKAFEAVS